jgi:hypothetical protein
MNLDFGLPPESTPETITDELLKHSAEISAGSHPFFVPMRPIQGAMPGQAFANVVACLSRMGGQSQLGWRLVCRPGILLRGYFHACWVSPDNEIIDVTPAACVQPRTLFLPDLALIWQGKPIESRFAPLAFKREIQDYIALNRREEHLRMQPILEQPEYDGAIREMEKVARKLCKRI